MASYNYGVQGFYRSSVSASGLLSLDQLSQKAKIRGILLGLSSTWLFDNVDMRKWRSSRLSTERDEAF